MNSITAVRSAFQDLVWPKMERVLKPGRHDQLGERLKYSMRMVFSWPYRKGFLARVSANDELAYLVTKRPQLLHGVLSTFLDRRHGVAARFKLCLQDFQQGAALLGAMRLRNFANAQQERLSELVPGVFLYLGLNDLNEQEGVWAVSLRDAGGARLYSASFGFVARSTLFIASIQGPSSPGEGLSTVRELTKAMHGLRPPFVLLEALRCLGTTWKMQKLRGVDPTHHAKGRWNQRRSRLKFDYRSLWQEAGGRRAANGNWSLPLEMERRSMADIASRKRSMYRRRFDMLDHMHLDLATSMRAPAVEPSPRPTAGG